MTQSQGSDADAAELARLDGRILVLTSQVERARLAWTESQRDLSAAIVARDLIRQRILAGPPVPAPTAPAPTTTPVSVEPGRAAATAPAEPAIAGQETSGRTAQTVLFALGGLLLGTAAVVFTAVAWATFGNGGRAAILAIVTALVLTAPLLAIRRGLTATAETFAVLGFVLVLLDGYAAWFVNLFGAKSVPTARYVGLVFAVTTLAALAYRFGTRLTGPAVVASIVAQPVPLLLLADTHPTLAGWSLITTAVAAANLAVAARGAASAFLRGCSWLWYGLMLAGAAWLAVLGLVLADDAGDAATAGIALTAAALVFTAGAVVVGSGPMLSLAAGTTVVAVAVAASRTVALASPRYAVVLIAVVIAATALAGAALGRVVPPPARIGLRVATVSVTSVLLLSLAGAALTVAFRTVADALPTWQPVPAPARPVNWQLLAAIALATLGLVATVWRARAWRDAALVVGVVLGTLALPGSVAVQPWVPSTVDLAVAGGLALLAVRRSGSTANMAASAAAVLTLHAVLASLGRPEYTAAILIALVLVGGGVAAAAGRAPTGHRTAVGGSAALVGLLAVPPAVGASFVALDAAPRWADRATVAAVFLVLAALVPLRRSWVAPFAYAALLISAAVWPTAVGLGSADPVGVLAAGGLLATAAGLLAYLAGDRETRRSDAIGAAGIAAVPGIILLALDVLPAVVTVVALPYSWLGSIWSGVPAGVGLAAPNAFIDRLSVGFGDAIALGLLALASATAAYAVSPRLRSAVAGLGIGGPTAILVAVTAAEAPWPVVPAVTLALGLVITAAAAIVATGPGRTAISVTQGLLYIGSGLAGSLTVEWATLTGLGATALAAAVVGLFGRTPVWRSWAGFVGVGATLAFATTAAIAADLGWRVGAFVVLAAAAACLVAGAALRRRGAAEATTTEASAHAGAALCVSATLLGSGSVGLAAAVATVWGLIVGLRALWPGTTRAGRIGLAAGAAGWELLAWWLLLAEQEVATVEAYTLPLSAVALLAGWAALRARPELSSWIAYGPALGAAFLPSLATLLVITDPVSEAVAPGWRRLMLGAGALAVVVAGTQYRRQAPVVVGSGVLAIVALHEIVVFWDLAPRWIPPAIGGLILVGLAMTYERRRRDMVRLREAIGRMT